MTVTPNSGAVLFRKDSNSAFNQNRPSSLQVQTPTEPGQLSEPIPVPTQVEAFNRMQNNSPTSPLSHTKGESCGSLKKVY